MSRRSRSKTVYKPCFIIGESLFLDPGSRLRPARRQDGVFVLKVRNEPGVRAASFQTDSISAHTHTGWYRRALRDKAVRLFVISPGNSSAKVGSLRLNRISGNTAEIHIALLPQWRGKGVARSAVLAALRLVVSGELGWKTRRIVARIKSNNKESIALFLRCGFVADGAQRRGVLRMRWNKPARRGLLVMVDCGPDVGLGHVTRQAALSRSLVAKGFSYDFWVRKQGRWDLRTLPSLLPAKSRVFIGKKGRSVCSKDPSIAALIVDTQTVPGEEEVRDVLAHGLPIIFIGNYPYAPSWVSCCINTYLKPMEVTSGTRLLHDARYTILSADFIRGVRSRKKKNKHALFVLPGGGNTRGMVFKILRSLDGLRQQEIHLVLGKQFTRHGKLAAFLAGFKGSVRVHKDIPPRQVGRLMASSRLAILSYGRSLDEARLAGLPSLLLSSNPLNAAASREASRWGDTKFLGDFRKLKPSDIRRKVVGLLESKAELFRMSRAARRRVDAHGAERVAKVIQEIIRRQGE